MMNEVSRTMSLPRRWVPVASVLLGFLISAACSSQDTTPVAGAGRTSTGGAGGRASLAGGAGSGTAGSSAQGGAVQQMGFALLGAPLSFGPTPESFGLNVVLTSGDPSALRVRVRAEGEASFGDSLAPMVRAADVAEWKLEGLRAGTRYEYELVAQTPGDELSLYRGSAVTARAPGAEFQFALLSDSHIGAHLEFVNQGDPSVLSAVSAQIAAASPDFVVNLGDMLDFHEFGFNAPPPDSSITRLAYLNYRSLLGIALGSAAHFPTIGNWEGENGDYTAEEIERSRSQRLLYMPSAEPQTYPQGGSNKGDYYAFTWGDALFIVLNVMSYTPTPHLLSSTAAADDWTLGKAQLDWLASTLQNATSKWRFLLIHHAVGGAAPDAANAAYGRGGGNAARVGEQAIVHQLMLDYGVQIFFYGHDHVFTDMVVDGVHYTMPGSSGAIWMFGEEETGYKQYWAESGWARVDVSPTRTSVRFINLAGSVIYDYALTQ